VSGTFERFFFWHLLNWSSIAWWLAMEGYGTW